MNKVILMGRLTRDPDVRYSTGENPLAIDRLRRRGGNERKWMLKR
jgi:single-stranded DNA-binding protein